MSDDRNQLKCLKELLGSFSPEKQNAIARQLVRHAACRLSSKEKTLAHSFIDVLDRLVLNKIDIHSGHSELMELLAGEWTCVSHDASRTSSSLSPVGGVLQLLMLAVCKAELETASLMVKSTSFQPSALDVGLAAARVFSPTAEHTEEELEWQISYARSESNRPGLINNGEADTN